MRIQIHLLFLLLFCASINKHFYGPSMNECKCVDAILPPSEDTKEKKQTHEPPLFLETLATRISLRPAQRNTAKQPGSKSFVTRVTCFFHQIASKTINAKEKPQQTRNLEHHDHKWA